MPTLPVIPASNHALRRAVQRYALSPADPLIPVLLDKCRRNDRAAVEYYAKQARAFVYKVRHGRRKFRLVVDRSHSTIITFLPPDAEKEERYGKSGNGC